MSKFIYFVLCVVAVSISSVDANAQEKERFRDAIRPIVVECSSEYGVSRDDLLSAKRAGTAEGLQPCFLGCVYKKAQVLNSKGEYDVDTTLTKLKTFVSNDDEYARFVEVGKKCVSVNDKPVSDGDAGCERGALLTACFVEHKAEIPI